MKTYSCGSVSERHSAHIAAMALPALWLFLLNVGILSLFPSNAAAADKLIVGVSLPLSGGNASFGEASRKGFAMALKEDPKKFDKLDFRFSDNSYSASQAISSFNSLVSAENADVIYMWGSAPCLATAALAEKRSLPLICFAGDKKPGLSYVYGFVSPFSEYARPLAQVIRDRGFERIAVVYSEIPFLSSLAEALRVQVEARQLASFIGFAPTAQDFRSLVLKFKQQRVDALVVFLLPDQIGPFIQQVKEQGMAPALIGTDTLTDPTVLGVMHR
ncbi:MAG: ABC transporter substrate-binding protein [Bdellovibrionota bacterium]|nr:MAG: ABC transporter substrate-binding protein [Bdellovibrionota bacterium]